jgi:hypothetical protein
MTSRFTLYTPAIRHIHVKESLTKIGLGEEELCAMGYHGSQEHTPLGRKVDAKQQSGKEEVGY